MSGRKEEVTEKIPEPFEYFAFVEKPFEKKQLVDAIKEAMRKAGKRPAPQPQAEPSAPPAEAPSTSAAEIEALNAKINKMQAEIDGLKKQLTQIVSFIKQKLK
jgi:DNA-binding NtrC family response regulator